MKLIADCLFAGIILGILMYSLGFSQATKNSPGIPQDSERYQGIPFEPPSDSGAPKSTLGLGSR
jgi:hypothetical protein